jgi:3-phenylpropionate/trans-cinnamate dioxygenase alpha subunit
MKVAENLLQQVRQDLKQARVPLSIFADPEIFQLERQHLFARAWSFLAHESEVPQPGDYVLRYVGPDDQVIVVRGEDGKVRAFHNICTHRGQVVCRAERGNTSSFVCSYHGWSFKNTGELTGVPAYKESFGYAGLLKREELGLKQVRIETYNGLIFGTLDASVPSLDEFLGNMKFYLDISPTEAMRV